MNPAHLPIPYLLDAVRAFNDTARSYNDARAEMEKTHFDIVLCDYHFSETTAWLG